MSNTRKGGGEVVLIKSVGLNDPPPIPTCASQIGYVDLRVQIWSVEVEGEGGGGEDTRITHEPAEFLVWEGKNRLVCRSCVKKSEGGHCE